MSPNEEIYAWGGGLLNRVKEYLSKDINEYNKVFLGLVCLIILMTAVFTSLKISNSYAIFTDTIKGEKTITLTLDKNLDKSGANKPVLSNAMVPVYYDSEKDVWRKADKENKDYEYKWYDYNNKMWANSVTYDHTKLYNEGTTIEGKTFNGTSDYVNTGVGANQELGNKITVAARFKISKLNNSDSMKIISNTENGGLMLQADIHNKISFVLYSTKEDKYVSIASSTVLELDKWYVAVGIFDGNLTDGKNMKLYINGKLESSMELQDNIKSVPVPFAVGAEPGNGNVYAQYFNGTISDALVLNDVIDENIIKKNYSGEVNHIDNENQLFYTKFDNKIGNVKGAKYTNEGMTFDGENDYVDVGLANYDFGNTITIAARFKTSMPQNDDNQYIISNNNGNGFGFYISKSGYLHFDFNSQLTNQFPNLDSKFVLEKNKWYTAVATYDGSNVKLYINGVLKDSKEYAENIIPSNISLLLGANPEPTIHRLYFNGTISDVLIMDKTLSDSESKKLSIDNNFSTYATDNNTLIYNNLRSYESRENGIAVPMDMISTMQVWIPRYKYKVWNYNEDGTKPSEPQPIEITFEEGENKTGEITCTDKIQGSTGDGTSETCTLKTTKTKCTDDLCNEKTYTHPGFTFGDEELSGFWVGKFELSSDTACTTTNHDTLGNGCNLDSIRPEIKPNLYSWRGAHTSTFETVALAMNDDNNKYGFSEKDDTHIIMLKEWGAIAYLSHSKYGKDGEVDNNAYYNENDLSKMTMTGCGPKTKNSTETMGTCNSYNTELGKLASTTGNIYGVYDMARGAWEKTMLNTVGPDGISKMSGPNETINSGYKGKLYANGQYTEKITGIDYPDKKYYELSSYTIESSTYKAIKKGKLGEMVREMQNNITGVKPFLWNQDGFAYIIVNDPWFNLGGGVNTDNTFPSGIFTLSSNNGSSDRNHSSRLIISNIN